MILEKQIKKEREKAALEATIKTVIKISRYYGASDNETAVNLIKELDITREEAEKLICNYDKEMDDEALTKHSNKWLAEMLGKDQATISKWCTNTCQPDLETLIRISDLLKVDVNDLLNKKCIKE